MTAISDIISLGIKGPQGQIKANMASSVVVMEDGVTSLPASLHAMRALVDEFITGDPNADFLSVLTALAVQISAHRETIDAILATGWLGGGNAYIGKVELHLRPPNQLPPGWIHMNGLGYPLGSAVGDALDWLRQQSYWQAMESQWTATSDVGMKIAVNGNMRHVPNWYFTDGRGPAMRAASGASRQVGTAEEGAIRNIEGEAKLAANDVDNVATRAPSGAFVAPQSKSMVTSTNNQRTMTDKYGIKIDASRVVPTANEVIMLNRGMTPAIFLGA